MNFPTLYKTTSTGKLQMWRIWTEGNKILTEWGQVDGKKQRGLDVVESGKNLGKVNETTAAEQAELDARGYWEKKSKKHYVTDPSDAMNGVVNETFVQGGLAPMLAHKYSEQGHKIVFPAAVQPKLDGHRCIAVIQDGVATLWTRTQKPITGVPHITEALQGLNLPDMVLDGELYNHDYRDNFEELSSFIRNVNPKLGHEVVQYHIYDIASDPRSFEDRWYDLYMVTDYAWDGTEPVVFDDLPFIKRVETVIVADEVEMMAQFEAFLAQGYEGLMVRNLDSPYVHKRSYDLQKVKKFDDAEFFIAGVEVGRGKMADKAVFICQTSTGEMFNVKMMGKLEDLKQYVTDPSLAIGRWLTVKYQGITNAAGVPRFPVGMRFRDDV